MSLSPVRKSRRKHHRPARLQAEGGSWNFNWKPKQFDPSKHKRILLALLLIGLSVGFYAWYADPSNGLFHDFPSFLQRHGPQFTDPTTIIWNASSPNNDLSEFNSVNVAFTSVGSFKGFILQPNGTQQAVALSKSSIGDLGIVAAKQLFIRAEYLLASGSCCGGTSNQFGFYLTVNKTLPTQLGYNPYDDPSVALLFIVDAAGGGLFNNLLFLQRTIGDTPRQEDTGGCSPASNCFTSGQNNLNPVNTLVTTGIVLNYTTQGNLATICSGTTGGPGCSEIAVGPGTSVPPSFDFWTQEIPWFRIQAEQYYIGFYSLAINSAFQIKFQFEHTTGGIFHPLDAAYYVPGPNCPGQANGPCNPDTGGFFGPVIKALISIGVFILNAILGFISFISPALLAALTFLESLIVTGLNDIGNAVGFGPLGSDIQALFNGLITFFGGTNFSSILSNAGAIFNRLGDALTVYFPWLTPALSVALNIATFGVKAIPFAITIITLLSNLLLGILITVDVLFFFVYTGDDAGGGLLAWLRTTQWLVFGLGIRFLAVLLNFLVDVATAIIGLIPKPMIQAGAHAFPRIPVLEVDASFVNPSFDLAEIRAGNLFSVFLWVAGLTFFAMYESANPPLIGSIGALLPAAAGSIQIISGFVPLLEIMTAFSLVAAILMIPVKMLVLVGLDLSGLPIDVGPGRKISGGPGGFRVTKATKHLQGRLEKKLGARLELRQLQRERGEVREKHEREIQERETREVHGQDLRGPDL